MFDDSLASSGVVIFVRQEHSFAEHSSSIIFCLTFTQYFGGFKYLPKISSLLVIPLGSSNLLFPADSKTDFCLNVFSSSRNYFILWRFNCHLFFGNTGGTSIFHEEEAFDYTISSKLLPLNKSDTPIFSTLFL